MKTPQWEKGTLLLSPDYQVSVWRQPAAAVADSWGFSVWAEDDYICNCSDKYTGPRHFATAAAARTAGVKVLFDLLTKRADKLIALAKLLRPYRR